MARPTGPISRVLSRCEKVATARIGHAPEAGGATARIGQALEVGWAAAQTGQRPMIQSGHSASGCSVRPRRRQWACPRAGDMRPRTANAEVRDRPSGVCARAAKE
jgi:hypothetical protein